MMTAQQRAAQFMPFKALTGYEEKIQEYADCYTYDEEYNTKKELE